MPRKPKTLSSADEALLSHTRRFGLMVVEAAAKIPAFAGQEEQVAEAALLRLQSGGLAASTWLYAGRRCFYPVGSETMSRKGTSRTPSLSEETKIRRFAMLSFCTLGPTLRTKPLAAELPGSLPDALRSRLSQAYYLESAAMPIVGFLRVDMGGAGRWDRVLAKCLADARKHVIDPVWMQLIANAQFEITLATTFPQKAERLCRALSEQSRPSVPIRVVVIPELLYLIAPPAS
jgi:hypothetical protein